MKHFVFGGVTTAPEASARNNEEMQITKIEKMKMSLYEEIYPSPRISKSQKF